MCNPMFQISAVPIQCVSQLVQNSGGRMKTTPPTAAALPTGPPGNLAVT